MILGAGAQTADSLLFNLADTLTGETELRTNLFEGHLRTVDAVECLDDVAFTIVEGLQGIVDL